MLYLEYRKNVIIRKYASTITILLLLIYLFIDFTITDNVSIASAGIFVASLFCLLIVLVSNKLVSKYEEVSFSVESRDGLLSFNRFGKEIYSVRLAQIQQIWFEPSSFLKARLVLKLNNLEEHAFKLPLLNRKSADCMNALINSVEKTA